jgi:hypothetical protein
MNLFPNFAAQRRPQFPQRVFQPRSIVEQRYRAPELLGAAAPAYAGPPNPTYWNPALGPSPGQPEWLFHIEPWQMPGGPESYRRDVTVTPSTTVTATAAEPATSWTDQIPAWFTAEMISGVPNYWLAVAAAGALLLLAKKGKR